MARRIRRSTGPLDLRAQAILRAVIEEYVTTATPVGSQALVDRYRLGVSSATVRNILAELELAGLLDHPHTSAGRIPTDAGYRWYVESIIDAAPLPQVEQLMIRHQFGQVEFASEHWFRLAASTIASLTHAAGLATPAKPRFGRVRRVDLVSINDRMASLVVVLREGSIKQALVTLDDARGPGSPSPRSPRLLNELVHDATARPDRGPARPARPGACHTPRCVERVGERIVRLLARLRPRRRRGGLQRRPAQRHGRPRVRPQREAPPRVHRAREPRLPRPARRRASPRPAGSRCSSAQENEAPDMREVALVLAPYGRRDRAVGVVGVLGPTRLAYSEAIGTVRFVSGLMNELVDHLYN